MEEDYKKNWLKLRLHMQHRIWSTFHDIFIPFYVHYIAKHEQTREAMGLKSALARARKPKSVLRFTSATFSSGTYLENALLSLDSYVVLQLLAPSLFPEVMHAVVSGLGSNATKAAIERVIDTPLVPPSAQQVDEYLEVLAALVHCAKSLPDAPSTDSFAEAQRLVLLCMYALEQVNFVEYNDFDGQRLWSDTLLRNMLNDTYDEELTLNQSREFVAHFMTSLLQRYMPNPKKNAKKKGQVAPPPPCSRHWRLKSLR